MFYIIRNQDCEFLLNKIDVLDKKLDELITRVAGYSSRINSLEAEVKQLKNFSLDEEKLIKLIQENSKVRETIKSIGG